jgi:hypothetical protein
MIFFWIFWAVDCLVALVILYFFFIGLADGSVSSFNMGLWLLILAVLAGVLIGGFQLMKHGHLLAAKLVLCILAVPGLLYGIFVLLLMGVKDWK